MDLIIFPILYLCVFISLIAKNHVICWFDQMINVICQYSLLIKKKKKFVSIIFKSLGCVICASHSLALPTFDVQQGKEGLM